MAFFCYGTTHCTKANQTEHERAGMAFHFLHCDFVDRAHFATDKPLLTGPEATGGQREYGVRVAGTWGDEVERTLTVS